MEYRKDNRESDECAEKQRDEYERAGDGGDGDSETTDGYETAKKWHRKSHYLWQGSYDNDQI